MEVDMKKNVMHISMTGLLLVLLLPLQVLAEGSGDGFRLDQSGTVTLDSSHAAKEGISSCCFSLTVEPENGNHVEFVFAGDLAEIMEYRYNADEKKLNVYVAGKDSLFPEGTESLAIGKVVVTDGSGNSGTATVSVDEGSLQFVYGAEARIMEDVAIPEAVKLGQSGGSDLLIPPPGSLVTPPPVETSEPEAPRMGTNPTGLRHQAVPLLSVSQAVLSRAAHRWAAPREPETVREAITRNPARARKAAAPRSRNRKWRAVLNPQRKPLPNRLNPARRK